MDAQSHSPTSAGSVGIPTSQSDLVFSPSSLAPSTTVTSFPSSTLPPVAGPAPDVPGSMFRHVPTIDERNASTLLPKHVSQLITGIATSTRMSLRISAFLVEAILESSRYSTKLSLGYTRQMLISAIWAARGMYHLTNEELNLNPLEILANSIFPATDEVDKSQVADIEANTDAFLSIFNKYTNLGVYLIHHTFTLAELFSMSGFFITTGAIKTVHQAASESVAIFDGLFGSSESSRALSAIISMVRREVLHDERRGNIGVIASMTGLTKALTAFACLQAATWQRTSKRLKLKVLYDCTILAEEVNAYTTLQRQEEAQASVKMIMKGTTPSIVASTIALPVPGTDEEVTTQGEARPLSLADMDTSRDGGGPGPSTMETRRNTNLSRYHFAPPLGEANQKLMSHLGSVESGPVRAHGADDDKSDWSMDDLDEIVGESGDEMYDGPPNGESREEHRQARKLEITDELRQTTFVSQVLQQVRHDDVRHRSAPLHRRQLSLPEFTAHPLRRGYEDEDEPNMGDDTRTATTSCTHVPQTESSLSLFPDMDETRQTEVDEDWIEVDRLLEADNETNALPISQSIGSSAYLDAIEHPRHNMERVKLVLQTVTHKFEQRKRTVRHIEQGSDGPKIPADSMDEDIIMIPVSRGTERGFGSGVVEAERTGLDRHQSREAPTSSSSLRPRGSSLSRSASNPALSRRAMSPLTPVSTRPVVTSQRSSRETAASSFTEPRRTSASPLRRRRPPPLDLTNHSGVDLSSVGATAPPPSPSDSLILLPPYASLNPGCKDYEHDRAGRTHASAQTGTSSTLKAHLSAVRPGPASQSTSTQIRNSTTRPIPLGDAGSPENLFPHEGLIRNIHRFMKFSSAAYGQNFLRILGMGQPEGPFPHLTKRGKHHANSWSFAEHVNIPIDCILLSSFTEPSAMLVQQEAPPLVHYVAVIHEARAIALTCRGTLGLSDLLVDLTCEYESIDVEEGDRNAHYYVHSGMWQSARKLTAKQSTVHEVLLKALTQYADYGLVLAGHSLGGGVASLLGILCSMPAHSFLNQNAAQRQPFAHPPITTPFVTNIASGLPPGRPIHVYAYGPPAVASPDLAAYASGLITSVVQDTDIVPTLSLGGVKDFKNISLTLSEEGNVAEEIVGRVIGASAKKRQSKQGSASTPLGTGAASTPEEASEAEALSDWMVSLIKTMRADMDNDKLYPPGTVYIMEHFDVTVTDSMAPQPATAGVMEQRLSTTRQAHRVILRQCESVVERFREPMFSKMMLQNHLPTQYERSTHLLYEGLGQGKLR
ncbi:hypothetical protein IAU59_007065 [Kwoniella sp. CBS 9459]